MGDKFMALAAVYVPPDGMNEKGLCVADLMVSNEPGVDQNTDINCIYGQTGAGKCPVAAQIFGHIGEIS